MQQCMSAAKGKSAAKVSLSPIKMRNLWRNIKYDGVSLHHQSLLMENSREILSSADSL